MSIDVYGRPVTAKGKFQFAFEGKFYKFPKVSTGACLVNSFPAGNFSNLNAQIVLTSNNLQLISKYDLK